MTTMKLIPAKGRIVPQENGMPWPVINGKPAVMELQLTRYLRRRLADGDLVNADSAPRPQTPVAQALAEPAVTDADASTRRKK